MNNLAIYDVFRKAGWSEDTAHEAAQILLTTEARSDLATKADLTELRAAMKVDLAELKVEDNKRLREENERLQRALQAAQREIERLQAETGALSARLEECQDENAWEVREWLKRNPPKESGE